MTHQEASSTIGLALEQVYGRLVDVSAWPRFLAGVQAVRRRSHERYVFTVTGRPGALGREVEVAVGHHPREHRITWQALAGPRFDGVIRLAEAGPEQTRVSLSLTVEPAGFLAGVAELAGVTTPAAVLDLQRLDAMLAPAA